MVGMQSAQLSHHRCEFNCCSQTNWTQHILAENKHVVLEHVIDMFSINVSANYHLC